MKNEYDISVLNKIVEDIDVNILLRSTDWQEFLISRISSNKSFNYIRIFNLDYSVLNENVQSHQPKRSAKVVVTGSIFWYIGCDRKRQGKLVLLNCLIIHPKAGIQKIGMGDLLRVLHF